MNRLVFTKLRDRLVSALVSEKRCIQMNFEDAETSGQIGTISIGKVRNVVKNINAAFVEYCPGVNGYYSLNDNPVHVFADGSIENRPLRSGDEILIQVSRAAVKTKDAVLSGELTLTGRYAAVLLNPKKFGISSKIKDKKWRENFKKQWETSADLNCGVIIRTNAYDVPFETVLEEAALLYGRLKKLVREAAFRTTYSILYRPDSFAAAAVRDLHIGDTEEIVTDIPEIYEELKDCEIPIRLYQDDYPLSSLYRLEVSLEHALEKNVWLKSGGYLVIEPTEAMTVIDVNTGKNIDKKTPENTYFKTNMEAAAEIAAQLRLRNLSGIIIVDFIDMTDESHKEELLAAFRQYLAADPLKARLVDMTALGLVEITRKKIRRPLHEQIGSKSNH